LKKAWSKGFEGAIVARDREGVVLDMNEHARSSIETLAGRIGGSSPTERNSPVQPQRGGGNGAHKRPRAV
jgi:hypothetical protein